MNDVVLTVRGWNGQIDLLRDRVRIKRSGILESDRMHTLCA